MVFSTWGVTREVGPFAKGRTENGDVAQLGERSVRNAEVVGSTPIISTLLPLFLLGLGLFELTPTSGRLTPKAA